MIARLRLEQFRVFANLDLSLGRVALLVGPNGSGKSTILEALDLVGRLGSAPSHVVFSGRHAPEHLIRFGQDALRLCVTFSNDPGPTDVEVICRRRAAKPIEVELQARWNGAEQKPSSGQPLREQLPAFADVLASSTLLRLDPRRLAEPSYSDDLTPMLGADGSGLATVLAHLRLKRSDDFAAIVEALRSVVPSVTDVVVDRARVTLSSSRGAPTQPGGERTVTGEAIAVTTTSGRELPAHAISEGTLLTLGLLTAVLGPQRPRVVLIDDIERGLHPKALAELVGQLRRLMALPELSDLQIVATTHSPYLVDHFTIDEVHATALTDDGEAMCAPLKSHPRWEQWRDEMLPGEFWSNVGERWIVDRASGR